MYISKVYHFKKIEVLFFVGERIVNPNKLEKGKLFANNNQLSVIGFQMDDEVITSHNEMPISDIIKITKSIKIQ